MTVTPITASTKITNTQKTSAESTYSLDDIFDHFNHKKFFPIIQKTINKHADTIQYWAEQYYTRPVTDDPEYLKLSSLVSKIVIVTALYDFGITDLKSK